MSRRSESPSRRRCSFPECDRRHESHGYCVGHLAQLRKGNALVPIRKPHENLIVVRPDGSAEIVLTNRQGVEVARPLIDGADVERVRGRRWYLNDDGYVQSSARRYCGILHRYLLDAPDGLQVDHENGNRMDNRRANLRLVTPAQQSENKGARSRTGHRNVVYVAKQTRRPWSVRVGKGRRSHYGGCYATEAEAIEAARALRARLFTHHNEARSDKP